MTHEPTQIRYPNRTTLRSVFQFLVGLCAVLPLIVAAAGIPQTIPWVLLALTIAGAVTRVMAIPAVNDFFQRYLPPLAARPADSERK